MLELRGRAGRPKPGVLHLKTVSGVLKEGRAALVGERAQTIRILMRLWGDPFCSVNRDRAEASVSKDWTAKTL